jgi:hypothetical protein
MTRTQKKWPIVEALIAILEGATLDHHRSREWYSATFVGEWHQITLRHSGSEALRDAKGLSCSLQDHVFNLPHQLVADIIVSNIVADTNGVLIQIEALLLNE